MAFPGFRQDGAATWTCLLCGVRLFGDQRDEHEAWHDSAAGAVKPVYAKARRQTAMSLTGASLVQLIFDLVYLNDEAAYNNTTGLYTVPKNDIYRVTARVTGTAQAIGDFHRMEVQINGSLTSGIVGVNATRASVSGESLICAYTGLYNLLPGQTVGVRVGLSAGTNFPLAVSGAQDHTFFEVERAVP